MNAKLFRFQDIEEMQTHAKLQRLSLIVYKKCIYNLTEYLEEYPEYMEFFQYFENKDATNVISNKYMHFNVTQVLMELQSFLYGYIEQKEKPVYRQKSSNLIITQTRKLLQDSLNSIQDVIPDDCCIKRLPVFRIHNNYHSQQKIIVKQ